MKIQKVAMSIVLFSSLSGTFGAEDVPQETKRPNSREGWESLCIRTVEQIYAAMLRQPSDDGVVIVGAAEVLLGLRDVLLGCDLSETSDTIQKLDREWNKYLSAAIAQKPASLPAEMNWHRRAILLKLIYTTVGQDDFKKAAELAVERDPDNGVAWMFLAEQKWAESDRYKVCANIQEVAKKNRFTLHNAMRHKRMRYALDKLGLYRKNQSWLLVQLTNNAKEFEVFLRHASLLRFAPVVGSLTGLRGKDTIRNSLANEYLSLLTFSGSPGTGIWSLCIHGRFFRKDLSAEKPQFQVENETSREEQLLAEEERIREASFEYLRFEQGRLDNLYRGSVEDIDAFLLDPIGWQKKCLRDWSKESSQEVGLAQWQEYWAKRRASEQSDDEE